MARLPLLFVLYIGKHSSFAQADLLPNIAVKLAAHAQRYEIVPISSDNHDSILSLHFTLECGLSSDSDVPLDKHASEAPPCMCASILLKLQIPKRNLVQNLMEIESTLNVSHTCPEHS